MHARIKPYSARHGRTTQRYSIGGKMFEEGYSSPKGQSRWYVVSTTLGEILGRERNSAGKKIFDVVTEAQARAIDIQEGNPHAAGFSTPVADRELRPRVFEQADIQASVKGPEPLWRYDPDAEHVPDLPEGFLESIMPQTARVTHAAKEEPKPRNAAKRASAPAKPDEGKAWEKFDEEQRVATEKAAERAARELLESQIEEELEQDEESSAPPVQGAQPPTEQAAAAGAVVSRRRRGDNV